MNVRWNTCCVLTALVISGCVVRDRDWEREAGCDEWELALWAPDLDGDGWGGAGEALRACAAPEGMGPPGDCDDEDVRVYPGAVEVCGDGVVNDCLGDPLALDIESATVNCDEAGWWYDVYAVGITGFAELYIYQTGSANPYFEFRHEFDPTQPFSNAPDSDTRGYWDDADGCWDNPYLELVHVENLNEVVLSSTTLFECNTERESTLTWSVVIYDTSGAAANCGSWGEDPTGTYGGFNFGACDQL